MDFQDVAIIEANINFSGFSNTVIVEATHDGWINDSDDTVRARKIIDVNSDGSPKDFYTSTEILGEGLQYFTDESELPHHFDNHSEEVQWVSQAVSNMTGVFGACMNWRGHHEENSVAEAPPLKVNYPTSVGFRLGYE